MSSPPQSRAAWRVPRAHLEGSNPTVLSVFEWPERRSQLTGNFSDRRPAFGLSTDGAGIGSEDDFLTGTGQCWEARKCFSPSTTVCNLFGLFRWRRTINGDWENWSRNGRLRKTRAGMDGEAEGGVGAAERAAALAVEGGGSGWVIDGWAGHGGVRVALWLAQVDGGAV